MTDERDLKEQEEVTYAVAAKVPACALWNLLDCRDDDGVPLMTKVEWLRFVQARSQIDQEWMQAVMTRVLIRARWMDKLCQGMFYDWKVVYDRHRGTERQLENTTRSLDGARRSAHNDRQLLMEFRSQSQRLQDEMAGDVERLQDQLTEADGDVDQVRANLVVLTRQVYDDRERFDLRMNAAEARSKELERKLGGSSEKNSACGRR
jgi:hypothetical protein